MHLFINNKWLKTSVEQRLKDQYIKKWQRDIRESSKGQIHVYNIFKTEFGPENILIYSLKHLEQYVLNLEPQITISQSKLGGIPKLERTCHVCNRDQIADGYHYILECNVFEL